MAALACVKDVELRLGRTFVGDEAGRAALLLDDASALVRAYTRRDFAPPASTTAVLRASGGVVRLPKRPVVSVTSVVMVGMYGTPDITVVGWGWDGLDVVDVSGWSACIINLPEAVYEADDLPSTYRITWTYGDTAVPPVAVAVVCSMVGRTMAAPSTVSGVTSETIGSYSYRMAEPGVGVSVSLTAADKELLDAAGYRPRAGTTSVRLR